MTPPSSSPQLTVIFDGGCGFCTRTVRLLRVRDRESRITWVPCQRITNDETRSRLCANAVVAIADGEEDATGAQAFARILTTITGSSLPVRIAALPVVSHMLAMGYWVIALLRTRLLGDSPWCAQHPDECLPTS